MLLPCLMNLRTIASRKTSNFLITKYKYANAAPVSYFHCSSPANNSDEPARTKTLPTLMDFPILQWPSFINTFRNWIYIFAVIKPHLDPDFNPTEFMKGAKAAVSIVSNKLAKGEWDDLEGLVDSETLSTLKTRLSTFSVFQRELLAVDAEDIFFAFPYQVGIIIPESEPFTPTNPEWREDRPSSDPERDAQNRPPQKRFVEITVVLHVLRGFGEHQAGAGDMKSLKEFLQDEKTRHNVMVCNYRFFRDYTKGVGKPEWIINLLNQFLPADYVDVKK